MAAPQQSSELPGETPVYPPQTQPQMAQPAPVEPAYTTEPKVEQAQPTYGAPPVAHQPAPRRGLMGNLDLPIIGVAGVLAVFNFIVLVLTAIRVGAANYSYDYLYLTLSQTKYLLALSVIDIPAIIYLLIYGSGVTSLTKFAVDAHHIVPTVLASVMALLFLIGGALEARFAAYDNFCNYYLDFCVGWNESSRGQVAAAAAFGFFIFLLWTFVAVWCGMRTNKRGTNTGVATV